MSLTGKLILGFLFALVLQVAQMLISGYIASSMRETTDAVSDALRANIAVQHSLDVVHDMGGQVAAELEVGDKLAGEACDVFEVFAEELETQAKRLKAAASAHAPSEAQEVAESAAVVAEQVLAVRAVASRSDEERSDALAFLDDALDDASSALQRSQVVLGKVGLRGIEQERQMRDLPWQAGLSITLCGIVIMAAFVTWFSRQLVIPIERAWAQLESRVDERTAELASTVDALESEIVERQRAEQQKEDLHRQLVDASRQAGMAELANGVLHNVGNVLNSVNVSANVLLSRLAQSRAEGLGKAVALLREHDGELYAFLHESPHGRKLPGYLEQLAHHFVVERDALLGETKDLSSYVDHMKDIVHRQQTYACASGVTSLVRVSELVDDALRMHVTSFAQHKIEVVRQIEWDQECELDRSRVVQILMNLIKNAKQAICNGDGDGGSLQIAVAAVGNDRLCISVVDDGVGIGEPDLARIFAHGFTTKSDGHGFGLHHSANAATEMGGRLWAKSEGPGHGASFVLELPMLAAVEHAAVEHAVAEASA